MKGTFESEWSEGCVLMEQCMMNSLAAMTAGWLVVWTSVQGRIVHCALAKIHVSTAFGVGFRMVFELGLCLDERLQKSPSASLGIDVCCLC